MTELRVNDYLDEIINEYDADDELNDVKADVAWVLGMEIGSDEWDMLMDI